MKLITLTQGRVALVDDADYERINAFKWHYDSGRARRGPSIGSPYRDMGHMVLELDNAIPCDHADHDPLNNQRHNLRVATPVQNARNRIRRNDSNSRFKGVYRDHAANRWVAYIRHNSRRITLGYFTNDVAAACAYDIAALLLFGEFASVNF